MAKTSTSTAPTGDTVDLSTPVVLIDDAAVAGASSPVADLQGDRTVSADDPNAVILVDVDRPAPMTVGDLRKAGYTVTGSAKDSDPALAFAADHPVGPDDPNAVILVDVPAPPDYSSAQSPADASASSEDNADTDK